MLQASLSLHASMLAAHARLVASSAGSSIPPLHITNFQAIVLGILQGVTELFPISSLGHTVIYPVAFRVARAGRFSVPAGITLARLRGHAPRRQRPGTAGLLLAGLAPHNPRLALLARPSQDRHPHREGGLADHRRDYSGWDHRHRAGARAAGPARQTVGGSDLPNCQRLRTVRRRRLQAARGGARRPERGAPRRRRGDRGCRARWRSSASGTLSLSGSRSPRP